MCVVHDAVKEQSFVHDAGVILKYTAFNFFPL